VKTVSKVLVVLLAVLLVCGAAFATIAWGKAFKDLYKPKADGALARAKCAVCHVNKTGGDLNPYGKALKGKTAGAAGLKSVENLDSDKDGKTNIQEIKADRLPGKAD